jgi:plastocyanin
VPTPRLDVSVDKTTLSTELLTDNMVTVTLQGSGGFAGPVTLAASVVDPAGAALPGWRVTLDKTSAEVAADGTATIVATLGIPSQAAALAGTLKIEATSSLGAASATSAVTVANQLSLPMTIVGTTCGPSPNKTLTVTPGTKVRWVNSDAEKRITIHVEPQQGSPTGFTHQADPGIAPLGAYEKTAVAAGEVTWYCHAPGTDANRYRLTVAP